MMYCVGLDVSLKETSICVVDERREMLKVGTEPETIVVRFEAMGYCLE